ncbi:MAG: ABC transporter permease [Longimicrobiales bacterium]
MSKAFVVFKREFEAMVRTKSFIIGTILIPSLLIGIFAFQFFLFTKTGGGEHTLAIVDATPENLGEQLQRSLAATTGGFPGAKPVTFRSEIVRLSADTGALRAQLEARVAADSLDGYLWLPAGVVSGEGVTYNGRNATNDAVTGALRQALQRSVQTVRLGREGIDPEKVAAALQTVRLSSFKTGAGGTRGSAGMAQGLAFAMGMGIYMVVAIYGAGVMNGVLEEKRDRIVEVIVSSMKATHLMIGKIFGIGAAGLLQMVIWVLTIFALLKWGSSIFTLFGASKEQAAAFGAALSNFPRVPASVTVTFLFYFLGGFFIFSTLYAMLGAIATNNQEAQQLVFAIMMPLIIGFLMLQPAMMSPDSGIAVAGSLIPFTSPIIMPARNVVTDVPIWQMGLSMLLLVGTVAGIIWLGAKIYRIGIFATGKRASWSEVWRWIRTA